MRPEKTSGSAVGRGFDSPHLHPTPRNLVEVPGFSLPFSRIYPLVHAACVYQETSGCIIGSGAAVAQTVEKDPAPLNVEECS
nr:MAG TPA: hypothetical protein [Caudoviricetes sp.]